MDVVILGCHVSGLGVIRALAGRARLIGVSYDEDDPGFVSRYLNERHRVAHYRVATPEWAMLCQFILKEETWTLAAKCGVPHPATIILPPGEQPSDRLD